MLNLSRVLHPSFNPSRDTTRDDSDELCHVYCCQDDTIALCGTPLNGGTCDDDCEHNDCIVCEDLDEIDCPLFCNEFCPKGRAERSV